MPEWHIRLSRRISGRPQFEDSINLRLNNFGTTCYSVGCRQLYSEPHTLIHKNTFPCTGDNEGSPSKFLTCPLIPGWLHDKCTGLLVVKKDMLTFNQDVQQKRRRRKGQTKKRKVLEEDTSKCIPYLMQLR